MVEMFRWCSEQLSENDYIDIKGRLSVFCNKEISFIRELNFIIDAQTETIEKFRIVVNRMDKSKIYLIKEREGTDCLMQNITAISEDEFQSIIDERYNKMKESENELIRDLAWNLELHNYKINGMVEYIQEKYIRKNTGEEFIFKSLKVDIQEGADKFLNNNLTASKEVDYDKKELICKRKIHIPVMLKQAL